MIVFPLLTEIDPIDTPPLTLKVTVKITSSVVMKSSVVSSVAASVVIGSVEIEVVIKLVLFIKSHADRKKIKKTPKKLKNLFIQLNPPNKKIIMV
jgi:hypothetical protein